MDVDRRRSVVVAGSVWESRMKVDEVKGGIKVFNGEETSEEIVANSPGGAASGTKSAKRGQTGVGKRKTWKSESPIQTAKRKPEELSVSADGIKKSSVQARKLRSEGSKEVGVSAEKSSPISMRKTRSESLKAVGESGEGAEKNSARLRKVKSDCNSNSNSNSIKGNGIETSPIQLSKAKPESSSSSQVVEESKKEIEKIPVPVDEIKNDIDRSDEASCKDEKCPVDEIKNDGSDDTCKEFGVCQEKVITDKSVVNYTPKVDDQEEEEEDDGLDVDEEDEEDEEEEADEEIEIEVEKKSLDVKEINIPEPKKVVIVNEEKKLHQVHQKPMAASFSLKQQRAPVRKHWTTTYQNVSKPTPKSYEFQTFQESHSKLQSFVDLVMWKEVARSTLVFLIGSFSIISSSYTKDLNLSFISVISYMGLVYLAAIFIYRSMIRRGVIDLDDSSYVLGEEEAIWLLRLVLPYVNELLLKLKDLFSGDPATTMKLAVLLFVLARCGSCITIWTTAKLGFFGVFTIPKVWSWYSAELTAYGKFWVRRFHDIWDSCSHKKAVAAAAIFLILNLSSAVARLWEVFMLYVAFRCYQNCIVREDWVEDEAAGEET